jgi:hypothetical protein
MWVYVVRKWLLRGRSRFVCWNTTWVSLWLLCNVLLMQSEWMSEWKNLPTWPPWSKGTDRCSSEEYRCTHFDACVARTWVSYWCVPCHPWCTHRTSLVGGGGAFLIFLIAVNNSIKLGSLVFLLWMFVITHALYLHKQQIVREKIN